MHTDKLNNEESGIGLGVPWWSTIKKAISNRGMADSVGVSSIDFFRRTMGMESPLFDLVKN